MSNKLYSDWQFFIKIDRKLIHLEYFIIPGVIAPCCSPPGVSPPCSNVPGVSEPRTPGVKGGPSELSIVPGR